MNHSQPESRFHTLRELLVPSIMIGCIGVYAYGSMGLSYEALIFPAVLVIAIAAALLSVYVASIQQPGFAATHEAVADEDDETGPVLSAKPWLMIAFPAALVASFEYFGVLTALVALVFGGQMIFGRRSPVASLLIAIVVVTPTYAIFKYFLYARFPAGLFGVG
jgi:DMSO reductase anchor subunit